MNKNKATNHRVAKKAQNDHIPKYIKDQPWFYKDDKKLNNSNDDQNSENKNEDDYLLHHRQKNKGNNALDINNNSEAKIGMGINDEVVKISQRSYRKNRGTISQTCANCGLEGHVTRDCLERPTKIVKQANGDTEEPISVRSENIASDYDAKRDRWFGFSWKGDNEVLSSWQKRQEKATIEEGSTRDITNNEATEWDTDEEIELTKLGLYKDDTGLLKVDDADKKGIKMMSVRLREDKANYLKDIYSEDIKYDPKSRIYKDSKVGEVNEKSNMFHRYLTGEGVEFDKLNKISIENAKKEGIKSMDTNPDKVKHVLIANPTKYEKMVKEMREHPKEDESKVKTVNYNDLEARPVEGKRQKKKTKKILADMYG
ncbi:hypothetical protein TPHA_0A02000 [Tetrapisispora phaffii CBS 4417]|uniref:Pre-mRNA-splicing factor SLU7 n=1 Tax=Tetrapisispora phaffii (strain ATCC 24235 / CBS 4417 / NBRC 1672 / NRRL Y-8282 / UCD 70-5) TaxID=1071381 RepID=G8BN04_TETPH|nr:hypothetical protein TPHA_0A02000 [Tetrapisispora phaffii CBS 4417]CCE61282.1 hypothetical protein TPHA_0A02000 [Tetrapisispora phaffii CBS 4417]